MLDRTLQTHDGLMSAARLHGLARAESRVSALELATLMLAGLTAALATACLDLNLRIPGHAIIRAVFPMALGLALVPRRMAGSVMGASALVSAIGLQSVVGSIGVGALTSLSLTGPALDLALWSVRGGWRLYAGMVLAGLGANLAALAVRAAAKFFSADLSGSRRLAEWWPQAIWSYAICGALAGLISAAAWFHFARSRSPNATPDT